ncbi:MAG: hypothetical protein SYR96_14950 [Actinomycetota bacterium]|nr:hypothetical protein [Actinomycetota bacterium]
MSTPDDRLARMEARILSEPSPRSRKADGLARESLEAFLQDSGLQEIHGADAESVHQRADDLNGESLRLRLAVLENERQIAFQRFRLWIHVIESARVALWILASWLPLLTIERIIQETAGDNSSLGVGTAIISGLTVALAIASTVTFLESRRRRRQVTLVRERLDDLERHLERTLREPGADWRQEIIGEVESIKRVTVGMPQPSKL